MKFLHIIILLLYVPVINAQIKFETSSVKKIISKAKKENKLIFLQLESAECKECNDVANKAFEDSKLDELKNNFIFLKISSDHPDRKNLNDQYNTTNKFAGTLFLNSDGVLIHRYGGTTTRAETYIEHSKRALEKLNLETISSLAKLYHAGKRDIDFLERFIIKSKEISFPTDSLLDEYVLLIPADSLKSQRVLQFIASNAPMINSRADTVLRHDHTLFNKMWYSMPLQQRIFINNQIIYKSKQKAIDTKDINYFLGVASFAKGTNPNPDAGEKAFQQNFLDYYKTVNDTTNFVAAAITYYERFLMTVPVSQIKKNDSLQMMNILENTPGGDTVQGYHSFSVKKIIPYAPRAQFIAIELNNGAWNLYNMGNDMPVLNKALQWAKRATEFFESPEDLDTYARLLYKTGNKNEAIEKEKKAIELQNKKGFKTRDFEGVLKKMQNNSVRID